MLPGMHATLASLVRNLGRRQQVTLHLFLDDMTLTEIAELTQTVAESGGVADLIVHAADLSLFKGLKTLHGQWMTYLRLLLPQMLATADTILYLDSDLVVNTDACGFFDHALGEIPLGAINGPPVEWSLDHEFLRLIGLKDDDRSFNAGVVLINAAQWRAEGLVEQSLQMARNYTDVLTSHDQSVLNALFSRRFYELPPRYNRQISPEDRPMETTDSIFHFVGSPKPWDLFGRSFHGNWNAWHQAVAPTQFRWRSFLGGHLGTYLKRAWMLRRSYIRTLKRRYDSN